ncbi:hypothetical protein, unknown function [Leishmania tarentolae]|uniref:Uncharacterized protein n=1 Tax=Leishmania tarentolae TaxID=5689 RepID=A0A640KC45_LEITA|nr:hypothetical protein, unknown function [Leishmania tarentolae]
MRLSGGVASQPLRGILHHPFLSRRQSTACARLPCSSVPLCSGGIDMYCNGGQFHGWRRSRGPTTGNRLPCVTSLEGTDQVASWVGNGATQVPPMNLVEGAPQLIDWAIVKYTPSSTGDRRHPYTPQSNGAAVASVGDERGMGACQLLRRCAPLH